jgi:predicted ArsR family transcriptional regulator
VDEIGTVSIPLDKDLFMRRMLRELSGALQDIVGVENAAGYVAIVGSAMGRWIDHEYRQALDVTQLDPAQVARVLVDLKQRIGGDFYIISFDAEKIVVGNRRCPFGEMAHGRQSLCQMTSNVFGRIAADNLSYARVALVDTIANGALQCRIVVHLVPRDSVPPDEREYYRVPD